MSELCPICSANKDKLQHVCDMCGALTMYSDFTREGEDVIYRQWMNDTATYTHEYDEREA
jgi:hypothetical protein